MLFDQINERSELSHVLARAVREFSSAELMQLLTDEEPALRIAACRQLQINGGDEVFNKAQELMAAPRYEHRETAAYLIGQLGTPNCPFADKSVPLVINALQDDYFEVRGMAASAAGHLWTLAPSERVKTLMERVIDLSADEEPYVRENVASSLAFFRTGRSHATLELLVDDTDADVRDSAQWAIEMHQEA